MTVRFPRFPWEGLLVCVLHSSFSAVSLKPSRSTHRVSASVSNYTFERAGLPARPSRLMGQSSTRACSGSDERSATSRSVHILQAWTQPTWPDPSPKCESPPPTSRKWRPHDPVLVQVLSKRSEHLREAVGN